MPKPAKALTESAFAIITRLILSMDHDSRTYGRIARITMNEMGGTGRNGQTTMDSVTETRLFDTIGAHSGLYSQTRYSRTAYNQKACGQKANWHTEPIET